MSIYETKFSHDRVHRYTLWREWADLFAERDRRPRFVNFICLNPSTATETLDDPTMRKCIKFAKTWGYDAMCVTNIFAFRSTDPEGMKAAADPVGPANDSFIKLVARDADLVVAAWSQHAGHRRRSEEVREILRGTLRPVHYLRMGVGKNPEPWHPLYLPDCTKPQPWVTI